MRLAGFTACACLLLGVAPGPAGAATAHDGYIQALLSADGSGEMFANVPEGHEHPVQWQLCATGGLDCQPFGEGDRVNTGSAPAGSVFSASEPLTQYDATSPLWHGNVSPATPPGIEGPVRANALVTPVLGTWNGGWEGDFDQTQIAACKTAAGTECTALTDPSYVGCPNEAAVIDPLFTGQYLRVADQVYGPGTVFADDALLSPYGASVWAAGPTVSVAVVGQIMPATGPAESSCGPPPAAEPEPEESEGPPPDIIPPWIPVIKPPSIPAAPSSPRASYPRLALATAPDWTELALTEHFGYRPTAYTATRCRQTGVSRFRCAVSWSHAGRRFAGTAEVGDADVSTGSCKLGYRIERTKLSTRRRATLVRAYLAQAA